MPRAKQLSAWVEDRPGMLAQVTSALGEKKVSIRALMASAMDGRGFIRMVVDKPAIAKKVLAAHGWALTEDDVVEVTAADKPGALGAVTEKLAVKGINVQYAYVGCSGTGRKVNLYLAVPDVKAALAALR
ncbi:MAG TPA: ACT domain-containing protein [Anaeromyxobacteraceae bacterium]|nr:ACT domain-containing protein [Anaeromyxobacteraceae bacterium]